MKLKFSWCVFLNFSAADVAKAKAAGQPTAAKAIQSRLDSKVLALSGNNNVTVASASGGKQDKVRLLVAIRIMTFSQKNMFPI